MQENIAFNCKISIPKASLAVYLPFTIVLVFHVTATLAMLTGCVVIKVLRNLTGK